MHLFDAQFLIPTPVFISSFKGENKKKEKKGRIVSLKTKKEWKHIFQNINMYQIIFERKKCLYES